MNKRSTLNDKDREEWINNDEGLYLWMRNSHMGMRRFIREHRSELDEIILRRLNRGPG